MMAKNGDIRIFLAKSQAVSQCCQAAPPPASPSPSRPAPPSPSPSPLAASIQVSTPAAVLTQRDQQLSPIPTSPYSDPLPTSPSPESEFPSSQPSVPESRQAIDRDAVIAASDDEEGYSTDESFLNIFNVPPRKTTAPTTSPTAGKRKSPRNHPCVTPRAKRIATANEFPSSPLTIQSKRKMYDFAALLELNQEDEKTRASAQHFAALLEQEKKEKELEKLGFEGQADSGQGTNLSLRAEDEGTSARQLKDRMLESAAAAAACGEDEDESGAPGGMRVVRALERADIGARPKAYYFFEQGEPEGAVSIVVGRPFPTAAATGPWAILADKQDRARHFQSGFPFDIQRLFKNIPDEIFIWVLDEVCSETRRDLSAEYVKLLGLCEAQLKQLVTPERLMQLFRSLGATKDVERLTLPITLREETSDPYPHRNWLCLENFLKLIGEISTSFSAPTRTVAMQILLRLGMDHVALQSFGLLHEWRWTVDLLARSVPSADWTSFVSRPMHDHYFDIYHSSRYAIC